MFLAYIAFLPAVAAKTLLSLQWAICDDSPLTVLRKLLPHTPIPEPYKVQNISYYDLPDPYYTAHGLAFRTKLHKHVPVSMVKARADNETGVPEADEALCKWDRYGNATWYTCGLLAPLEETKPL